MCSFRATHARTQTQTQTLMDKDGSSLILFLYNTTAIYIIFTRIDENIFKCASNANEHSCLICVCTHLSPPPCETTIFIENKRITDKQALRR